MIASLIKVRLIFEELWRSKWKLSIFLKCESSNALLILFHLPSITFLKFFYKGPSIIFLQRLIFESSCHKTSPQPTPFNLNLDYLTVYVGQFHITANSGASPCPLTESVPILHFWSVVCVTVKGHLTQHVCSKLIGWTFCLMGHLGYIHTCYLLRNCNCVNKMLILINKCYIILICGMQHFRMTLKENWIFTWLRNSVAYSGRGRGSGLYPTPRFWEYNDEFQAPYLKF